MRFELTYTSRYFYAPPMTRGLTALRLRPRSRPGVEVLQAQLRVNPGTISGTYVDGWETLVDLVECWEPHAAATFTVEALVETDGQRRLTPPTPEERHLFAHDSSRVRSAAVASLDAALHLDRSRWEAIETATAWIHQNFRYRVGVTAAETPVEQVVEHGEGVCQDFAHLLLALVRRWGWCARYVSGYQFSGSGEEEQIMAEAMHAWVEVYRPDHGWFGLDATTGAATDAHYIPVGAGRDYDDVPPIRGILIGAGEQRQEARLQIGRVPAQ